jgi:hypothetical protein
MGYIITQQQKHMTGDGEQGNVLQSEKETYKCSSNSD